METIRIERDRKHIAYTIIPLGYDPKKGAEYFRILKENRRKEDKKLNYK